MQYLNRQMENKKFTALVWKGVVQLRDPSLAAAGQLIEVQYPLGSSRQMSGPLARSRTGCFWNNCVMRMSREETAKTRKRIVDAASAEFRKQGIAATGLAEIMAAAGMTHGGFYRHFKSKDELVAETTAAAAEKLKRKLLSAASKGGIKSVVGTYLSIAHRDHPEQGCPLAALGSELASADKRTRRAATCGLNTLIDVIAGLTAERKPEVARERALVAVATMVGAMTIARVVDDPQLSKAILHSAEASITN